MQRLTVVEVDVEGDGVDRVRGGVCHAGKPIS